MAVASATMWLDSRWPSSFRAFWRSGPWLVVIPFSSTMQGASEEAAGPLAIPTSGTSGIANRIMRENSSARTSEKETA